MVSKLPVGERMVGRIPVRNLWLLMLYASELTRFRNRFNAFVESDIDDLPDLVATLLVEAVEYRLRRNLTRGYQDRRKVSPDCVAVSTCLRRKRSSYFPRGRCNADFKS
jgi:5-methylcytosine-specific restriction enzyme subunit McrC